MWTPEAVKDVILFSCKCIGVTYFLTVVAIALFAGLFGGKDD